MMSVAVGTDQRAVLKTCSIQRSSPSMSIQVEPMLRRSET